MCLYVDVCHMCTLTEAVPRQTKEPLRVDDPGELEKLSLAELTNVWKERHANKDAICGVVPFEMFDTMSKRGMEFPLFVYPVPRGDGYVFAVVNPTTSSLVYRVSENSRIILQ